MIYTDSTNGITYTLFGTNATVSSYNNDVANVVILETFTLQDISNNTITVTVTDITYTAFNDKNYIVEITIPSTITTLFDNCFSKCVNLTTVQLSGNIVLGAYAFSGCSKLSSFPFQYIISAGDHAFKECGFVDIYYNSTVIVQNSMFDSCAQLKTIEFVEGIVKIEDEMCRNCTSLIKVKISRSVNEIGTHAFSSSPLQLIEFLGNDLPTLLENAFPANITSVAFVPNTTDRTIWTNKYPTLSIDPKFEFLVDNVLYYIVNNEFLYYPLQYLETEKIFYGDVLEDNMGFVPQPEHDISFNLQVINDQMYLDGSLNKTLDFESTKKYLFLLDNSSNRYYDYVIGEEHNSRSFITSDILRMGTSGYTDSYIHYTVPQNFSGEFYKMNAPKFNMIHFHKYRDNTRQYCRIFVDELQVWVKGVNIASTATQWPDLTNTWVNVDSKLGSNNGNNDYYINLWEHGDLAINNKFMADGDSLPLSRETNNSDRIVFFGFDFGSNYISIDDLQSIIVYFNNDNYTRYLSSGQPVEENNNNSSMNYGVNISLFLDNILIDNYEIDSNCFAYKLNGNQPSNSPTSQVPSITQILDDNATFTTTNWTPENTTPVLVRNLSIPYNPDFDVSFNFPIYLEINAEYNYTVKNFISQDIPYFVDTSATLVNLPLQGNVSNTKETQFTIHATSGGPFYLNVQDKAKIFKVITDRPFIVTVSNGVYYVNGKEQPKIYISQTGHYVFDQSDSSNAGKPLNITHSSSSTLDVKYYGTPGVDGYLYIYYEIDSGPLHYGNSSGNMGNVFENATIDFSYNLKTDANNLGSPVFSVFDVSENSYFFQENMDISTSSLFYFETENTVNNTLTFGFIPEQSSILSDYTIYSLEDQGTIGSHVYLDLRNIS